MKKMLKFAIVVSIIFAMLSGNVAVIAANTLEPQATVKEAEETAIDNTKTIPQTTMTPQTPVVEQGKEEEPGTQQEGEQEEPTSSEDTDTLDGKNKEEIFDSDNEVTEDSIAPKYNDSVDAQDQADADEAATTSLEDEEDEEGEEQKEIAPGELFVTLNLKLPNDKVIPGNFSISLQKNNNGQPDGDPIPLKSATGGKGAIYWEFDNIPVDSDEEDSYTNYNLRITPEQGCFYQPYSQIVSVKSGKITRLDITNSFDVNSLDEKATRAVMGVGNVAGNSETVDDDDINEMIKAIENKSANYDLNGDGKTNIIDLSYIAINKGKQNAQVGDYWYEEIVIADETTFARTKYNNNKNK